MTRSMFTGTYSHKTPMPNCCGPKPDITMSGLHLLTLSLIVINIGSAENAPGLYFVESPMNVTSSLGKPVGLQCTLRAESIDQGPLDVLWLRNGQPLEFGDTNQMQVPDDDNNWLVISKLRIDEVQLSDMGTYQCAAYSVLEDSLSIEGHIQLEGLPYFSVEPQHMSVVANVRMSLQCTAHGPPEPVWVIWLQDGAPLNKLDDPISLSPSTFTISGLNKTTSFSCEAHNRKGVASSGTGVVTVLPAQPHDIKAEEITNSSIHLSWKTGFGGIYPISLCTVQVKSSDEDSDEMIYDVSSPKTSQLFSDLQPFSQYDFRVACQSSQGDSDWTVWETISTNEGVPDSTPENVTAVVNGTEVQLRWSEPSGKMNGQLQGYMMEYISPNMEQVVVDTGLNNELFVNLSAPLSNISFRVCAYTTVGQGPWTPLQTITLIPAETPLHSRDLSSSTAFSWHWWYVVMAIAAAIALAVLLAVYVTKLRRKETRFGEAFEPMMESGELVVRYRARRTYSRRTTEATLNTLGISDELKQKLQDVMVDRHKLMLGKTLGEGEFGSVMEGLLTQEDSVLKVAVKTMKIAICTRTEMEDFLREAACMKEFDHQNVMRLLGVCLQTVESEGYPSPVVILPYMKHGDLHSYLLYSRLGDSPVFLPSQMLVKFMTDIARGMEYLSAKKFIHRDLAARNCMLNENMNVCVADFGLSKKIYNGDYYRQGRISKMPVKWIAIESLADRVYTTKSDVWSFGVTMWEIATRGQTPYPGVENSEIYDYLRQGNRLKQPPDCLDSIYSLMFSCWLLSPKDRPSFEILHCELEKVLEDLPSQDPDEILYVNMEESTGELGAVGGRDPITGVQCVLGPLKGSGSVATVEVHHPNRYVICPQHENQRPLNTDSMESLNLMASTPALQPSSCSTPVPPSENQFQEERDSPMVKKVPWQ
ncbi:tyrosine-protein kinase receptor UFO isoform X1 [Triplophysa dalaica]|uniref:tyrosine-protein kinase receptor UFO isoform X1 n=3 Tax=Triplophysa dalaica TaxID=1582913 RepID=UPI0024DF4379|nr:tyrosine-protein kinase receptor UFO isoform X1 [Triplophysa dalaica]